MMPPVWSHAPSSSAVELASRQQAAADLVDMGIDIHSNNLQHQLSLSGSMHGNLSGPYDD